MSSIDFPWLWSSFPTQIDEHSLPSPMVLCIEECLQPQLQPTDDCASSGCGSQSSHAKVGAPRRSQVQVLLDGKNVSGGTATEFPTGMICLNPSDMSACLQFILEPDAKASCNAGTAATPHEDELDLKTSFTAEVSVKELAAFGSPLYTSLWLGLANTGQDASLCSCLLRARCIDGPKIKITMFDKGGLQSASSALLLRPNVKRALFPSADEDGSCFFSARPSCDDREVSMAIQCVEGLIRCLDEGNNMVADLHKSMHSQALLAEEEHARVIDDKEQSELNHSRAVLQKDEAIDALQKELQQMHADFGDLQKTQDQTKQNHCREVSQKNDDIGALQNQLQQLHSQVGELQIAQDHAQKSHHHEVLQKSGCIDALEKQMQQVHAQTNDLRTEVLQKNEFNDSLQKQLQQVHAQVVHMQTAQEQAQQKHSRVVLEKDEGIDILQKQLQQVHAQVILMNTAQEHAQKKHSREVLDKDEDIGTLQKQLQQVHAQVAHLQTAQEQAAHKHSREVLLKNEDIEAHQKQLRQVHAYVAELQNAQEQAQQTYSCELLKKNQDMDALHEQLQGVRNELEVGASGFEKAMEAQKRIAEETITRQQDSIHELEEAWRLAASMIDTNQAPTPVGEPPATTSCRSPRASDRACSPVSFSALTFPCSRASKLEC